MFYVLVGAGVFVFKKVREIVELKRAIRFGTMEIIPGRNRTVAIQAASVVTLLTHKVQQFNVLRSIANCSFN